MLVHVGITRTELHGMKGNEVVGLCLKSVFRTAGPQVANIAAHAPRSMRPFHMALLWWKCTSQQTHALLGMQAPGAMQATDRKASEC